MDKQKSNNKGAIKRRGILSAVGSVATAAGLPIASAENGRNENNNQKIGSRFFTEVAIHHRGIPDVSLSGVDPMNHFRLDVENRNLQLMPPIGKKKLSTFRGQKSIVGVGRIPRYFPVGKRIPAKETTGPQVDHLDALQTLNQYYRPEIKTRRSSRKSIVVSVNDKSISTEKNSFNKMELEPIEVEYYQQTNEYTQFKGRKGRQRKAPKYETETTSLTPVVKIFNHGELEAYEPEEVMG